MKLVKDLFESMQVARSKKEMKMFVSYVKEKYEISLSIRDIRKCDGLGENVYNDIDKFNEYLSLNGFHNNNDDEPKKTETTKTETTKKMEPKENDLIIALKNAIGETKINEDRIIELIKEHSSVHVETKYINKVKETSHDIKLKHKQFDDLLALISAGLNVWITGEAGGGKTHSAGDVAKVLGLDFYTKSISAQTSEFAFFGFINAGGVFVETDFYKAYTNGGVFCIDEIDNGSPNLLAVLNSALANGKCSFANGTQTRHKDFIVVATANTIGNGGNSKYAGRLKIDKSTIDRFCLIEWEYDTKLELALYGNKLVHDAVLAVRNKVAKLNLEVVISPRATEQVTLLVNNGMNLNKAMDFSIYNKLSNNVKTALK
jgi:cobaltochelatase CobS